MRGSTRKRGRVWWPYSPCTRSGDRPAPAEGERRVPHAEGSAALPQRHAGGRRHGDVRRAVATAARHLHAAGMAPGRTRPASAAHAREVRTGGAQLRRRPGHRRGAAAPALARAPERALPRARGGRPSIATRRLAHAVLRRSLSDAVKWEVQGSCPAALSLRGRNGSAVAHCSTPELDEDGQRRHPALTSGVA